jgi:hypothetical protein
MVQQEVWAHLLVHHAIRTLMHQAALEHDLDPDRLSFVGSLRIVRRQLVSHQPFSPLTRSPPRAGWQSLRS